jgi:hypothetical protein
MLRFISSCCRARSSAAARSSGDGPVPLPDEPPGLAAGLMPAGSWNPDMFAETMGTLSFRRFVRRGWADPGRRRGCRRVGWFEWEEWHFEFAPSTPGPSLEGGGGFPRGVKCRGVIANVAYSVVRGNCGVTPAQSSSITSSMDSCHSSTFDFPQRRSTTYYKSTESIKDATAGESSTCPP